MSFYVALFSQAVFHCLNQRAQRFLFVFSLTHELDLVSALDARAQYAQYAFGIRRIFLKRKRNQGLELHRLLAQDTRRSKMQACGILDYNLLTYHLCFPSNFRCRTAALSCPLEHHILNQASQLFGLLLNHLLILSLYHDSHQRLCSGGPDKHSAFPCKSLFSALMASAISGYSKYLSFL